LKLMSIFAETRHWMVENGPWWLCSFVFHMVLVCSLALLGNKTFNRQQEDAPEFEEATLDQPADVPKEIERFEVGETPEDPTELNSDTLAMDKPAAMEEKHYDDSTAFVERKNETTLSAGLQSSVGGLAGFDIKASGSAMTANGHGGNIGVGSGTGRVGDGQSHSFGGRSSVASKKALLASGGGTRQSERSVAAALNWFARHQSPGGNWSYELYKPCCTDGTCTNPFDKVALGPCDTAATAMALLPFFAAGQTHGGAVGAMSRINQAICPLRDSICKHSRAEWWLA
jgi:hypothetical protein